MLARSAAPRHRGRDVRPGPGAALGGLQRGAARRGDAGERSGGGRRGANGSSLPIGTFLHLVLDGAFTRTKVFWWPLSGGSTPRRPRCPSVGPGFVFNVLLELAGAAAPSCGSCAVSTSRIRCAAGRSCAPAGSTERSSEGSVGSWTQRGPDAPRRGKRQLQCGRARPAERSDDHVEPSSVVNAAVLYLVRHGRTQRMPPGCCSGGSTPSWTRSGDGRRPGFGATLGSLDRVVSSPLTRTRRRRAPRRRGSRWTSGSSRSTTGSSTACRCHDIPRGRVGGMAQRRRVPPPGGEAFAASSSRVFGGDGRALRHDLVARGRGSRGGRRQPCPADQGRPRVGARQRLCRWRGASTSTRPRSPASPSVPTGRWCTPTTTSATSPAARPPPEAL